MVPCVLVAVLTSMALAHMPSEHFQKLIDPVNLPRAVVGDGKPIVPTPGKYITKGGPLPDKLNIHIVPHTHVSLHSLLVAVVFVRFFAGGIRGRYWKRIFMMILCRVDAGFIAEKSYSLSSIDVGRRRLAQDDRRVLQ